PYSLSGADPIAVMMRRIRDGERSTSATSRRDTPACSAARSMISSLTYRKPSWSATSRPTCSARAPVVIAMVTTRTAMNFPPGQRDEVMVTQEPGYRGYLRRADHTSGHAWLARPPPHGLVSVRLRSHG